MIPRACVLSSLLLVVASSMVDSYSQVAMAGSRTNHNDDGPKVFKALNMDLIYPKTFNSSENVISTTQTPAHQLTVMTESVESLSFTTGSQFTPERSSSQISGPTLPPDQDQYQQTPSEQAAVIPANHYPPTFVIPDDHGDESEERGPTLPPPATGRAVDYRPAYPFSQLLKPTSKGYTRPSMEPYPLRSRPVSRPSSSSTTHRVVYPSYQAPRIPSRAEIDKLSGKGKLSDRFTPSEAVASQLFRQNPNRNPKPSISRPIGQSSKKVTSFVPAKDLYTFPPNLMSRYPSPTEQKQSSPSDTVSSYLPPPAGPSDGSKFVGPVNPDLLLGDMKSADSGRNSSSGGYHYDSPVDSIKDNGGGYIYNPPQPPLRPNLSSSDQGAPPTPPPPAIPMDNGEMQEMGPPAPAADDGDMDNGAPPPPDHDHDHDHHYDHYHDHGIIGGYEEDKEYPTPPPGYLEEHDHNHDHDHGHDHYHPHHHPDIDFTHGPYLRGPPHDYDHYDHPDIIYDDYHHDHHHDHIVEHHPLPEITTEVIPSPPPPAPEQPRVKKYSYFYIGRKLWYIPLYFTLWFTFYVLWLILKSIARHKVNLPNHYVQRRSLEGLSHREAREAIDKLTAKVMDGIENFKLRYIG